METKDVTQFDGAWAESVLRECLVNHAIDTEDKEMFNQLASGQYEITKPKPKSVPKPRIPFDDDPKEVKSRLKKLTLDSLQVLAENLVEKHYDPNRPREVYRKAYHLGLEERTLGVLFEYIDAVVYDIESSN